MKQIYLDYNSTTPVDEEVLETMLPYFSEKFGNAASKTHAYGWIAAEAVDKSRQAVADFIHASPEEIIFTSGATEAINLALKGTFEAYQQKGKHIVTVQTEHKAVLDTCHHLEKLGAEITFLPVDREGMVDAELLEKSIRHDTILICIMMANNETGVIQPVEIFASIAKKHSVLFLSDATQAAGKIRIHVEDQKIDLLAFSSHKIYGPKGVGALYIRRKNPRVNIISQMDGGGHEKNFRSGTLNVPGIVGFGKACEIASANFFEESARISKLRTMLEQKIEMVREITINGSIRNRLPNTSNLRFHGIKSSAFISAIPEIAVATGSACTSAIAEPSHVLKAMGLNDDEANESIRFSLGRFTTEEEIDFVLKSILKLKLNSL